MRFHSHMIFGGTIGAILVSWGALISCSRSQETDYESLDSAGESYRAQIQCDGGQSFDVALYGAQLPQKVPSTAFRRDVRQNLRNCQVFIILAQTPQPTQYRWLSKSGKQNVLYQSVEQTVNFSESGDILNINARYYKTHEVLANSTTTQGGTDTFPPCVAPTADQIKSGWGWENGKSCKVVPNQGQPAQTQTPQIQQQQQYSSTAQSGANQYPDCQRNDSDPDGDGWGWENGKTCRMKKIQAPTPAPQMQQPAIQAPQPAPGPAQPQFPNCQSAASDPDGDGWGYENNQSCRVVK